MTANGELRERIEATLSWARCSHCQGTGKPQCVSCDDYQYCRCTPGHGRFLPHCWACKGQRFPRHVVEAVDALEALIEEAVKGHAQIEVERDYYRDAVRKLAAARWYANRGSATRAVLTYARDVLDSVPAAHPAEVGGKE